MISIWTKDYIDYKLPIVNKDIETPILIIGGGISGLMCAYFLMKEKQDFILIDRNKLACGVSMYTTAQVSVAHGPIYEEISKTLGKNKAKKHFINQLEGLNLIRQIIKEEKIDCDYKEESTILYTHEEKNMKILEKQYDIIKTIYPKIFFINENKPINFPYGLEFTNQFIFNPMKYMMKIADILIKNQIPLYENSTATKIIKEEHGYKVIVNNEYSITTPKIIMTCQYPFLNPDNLYFAKLYQSKSYAISFKTNVKLRANYVSLDAPYYYFRTYDHKHLIIGGCDHYTGSNKNIEECYDTLIKKIKALDPNAEIIHKWYAEDCISTDSLPFIGHYSNNNPNILLVTGFQKWGFTNSHIAAKKITDIILDKKVDNIYSPHRVTLFKNIKSTFRMIIHSINGLILSKIFVKKYNLNDIEIGSGKIIKYNNLNVLAYRESKNKFILLKNKCPHMGCSLIWNNADKLWECKCHGSIFDKYGKVIYGPSTQNLEVIEYKDIKKEE